LVGQGAVCSGMGSDGEGAVHRLALDALDGRSNVLSPASPGQVRHPLLEAAVEYKPAVLVSQGHYQEVLHEKAGARGAAVGVGGLEGRGINGGAGGQETVRCVVHAQEAGDRGGGGTVHGVDCALCKLHMEAEWSCEGGEVGEGLLGRCWGTL
jgi:hypothetical protein